MSRETGKLASRCGQVRFASRRLRAGIAREKLIFFSIVLAAVVVSAVTLVIVHTRPKGNTRSWECLECGYIFENMEKALTPIECPKCGGQAVRLRYRNCKGCGAKVPMYHTREIEGVKEVQYYYKQEDGNYGWSPWRVLLTEADAKRIREGIWKCPNCE